MAEFAVAARRAWQVAAVHLRWSPDLFWAATPMELADAFAPPDDADGATRGTLDALMARFPDEKE